MSERFRVHLGGVIDLLANHLYSTEEVYIREALQNAVDAVAARRVVEPGFAGKVEVELVESPDGPATVIIRDDGVGLTTDQVHEFLSTIGASSKRADASLVDESRGDYLGRFGIGLLSCFMVSDEIVVVSQSVAPGAPAVEWRGKSDGHYAVRELGAKPNPGTQVFLRAKEDAAEQFTAETLERLLRQYGQMLSTPVEFAHGANRITINRPVPPWEIAVDGPAHAGLLDYCRDTFEYDPIDVIEIRTGTEAGGVVGRAFVTPSSGGPSAWVRHDTYLKGMFVSSSDREVLPRWAFFVNCVLNASSLRPTASREGFYSDDALDACREEAGRCIRNHLLTLARRDPQRLAVILTAHDVALRALAVEDDEFFDVVIDILEFESTVGRIPFGHYRREHEVVRLARTGEQYRRILPVAAARGVRVFNGGYTYHEELLRKAAHRLPGLRIEEVDAAGFIETFEELTEAESRAAAGLVEEGTAALEDADVTVVCRRFEPTAVPAMFGQGLDAEYHRSIDFAKRMASGLWGPMLDALRESAEGATPVRLCLNWSNPLVRVLAATTDKSLQRLAVRLLHVQALMTSQQPLTSAEAETLTTGMIELMGRAIRGGDGGGGAK